MRLPTEQAHHARQVLRLADGAQVVLFDGEGGEYAAQLQIEGRDVAVAIGQHMADDRMPPLTIHIVQGLAVGDKMDWVVQKGSEIGVVGVTPVAAERSVLKLVGDRAAKRVSHWQQVAVASAEQCGRNRVLQVGEIRTLATTLSEPFEGERWILDPDAGERLSALPAPAGPVAILIGPEGGWSPTELAAAHAAGCRRVLMGPRVLRTETAGLAVAAAMLGRWGDY
ncbi:16S rRNA (uracil(1498)-N(3))-methyltransferase [Viridibacterium curvum]|uniref:Ribosomal RNA small subunit methyltransferase E n=1 Tax=Viridibacterium curvum TaxID=1101404 RepID=A0ABP9QL36_9RHOO